MITTGCDAYQWQVSEDGGIEYTDIENNAVYSNATTSDLSISGAGLDLNDLMYRCAATTVGGTSYSLAALLKVDPFIKANAGNDDNICVSTEYQLSAEDPGSAEGTWSCDIQQVYFSDINDPNATVYDLPEGNTNIVWTIVQDNVCGTNSDILVLGRNSSGSSPDKPSVPNGPEEICLGSTSELSVPGGSSTLYYFWEITPSEAGSISENTESVTAVWSSFYTGEAFVKVKARNECGDGEWSDSLIVELKDVQANDIIQKSESMLVSVDSGYAYQWYLDGSLIPDARKQYYYNESLENGTYRVKVKFYEGCEKLSSELTVDGNKSTPFDKTLKIFPNPSTDRITINIDNDYSGKVYYVLTDNVGRIRKENTVYKDREILNIDQDLDGLQAGSYVIEFIFDSEEKICKQLIIK